MSWRKIPMKFQGKCIICNGTIKVGEFGLWSKDVGVKHEGCDKAELDCIMCKKQAGCSQCEFYDVCDIPNVSKFCICKACSQQKGAFGAYQESVHGRFPAIK